VHKRIQDILGDGILKREWDSWSALEQLQEGWDETPEVPPWEDFATPFGFTLCPDNGHLDDLTKSHVNLLLQSQLDTFDVDKSRLILAQVPQIRNTEKRETAANPFDLLGRDGRLLRSSIFQLAASKSRIVAEGESAMVALGKTDSITTQKKRAATIANKSEATTAS
jgi:hypothetical protein